MALRGGGDAADPGPGTAFRALIDHLDGRRGRLCVRDPPHKSRPFRSAATRSAPSAGGSSWEHIARSSASVVTPLDSARSWRSGAPLPTPRRPCPATATRPVRLLGDKPLNLLSKYPLSARRPGE